MFIFCRAALLRHLLLEAQTKPMYPIIQVLLTLTAYTFKKRKEKKTYWSYRYRFTKNTVSTLQGHSGHSTSLALYRGIVPHRLSLRLKQQVSQKSSSTCSICSLTPSSIYL